MLIGLTGAIASGKDTTYERIKELYPNEEVIRVGYADKMKDSIAALFGIDRSVIEAAKRDDDSMITFESLAADETVVHMSFREFIQNYGTEAHRGVFGYDFWLDAALPKDFDHSGKIVCVTDARFENELQRVVDLGGTNILVVGEEVGSEREATHESENSINLDLVSYTIDNREREDRFAAIDQQIMEIVDNLLNPHTLTRELT
jgi:hypothetical protein